MKKSQKRYSKRAVPERNYKDTVWRMLCKERERLLALYNAVNQTNYTDVDQLTIVTLENAIYLGYKNDLAFLIGDSLNLYEHQSTYNPNMPIRMLFYVTSEYELLMRKRSLYSSTLQKIPTPKFIVFYNGQDKQMEKEELFLSDAYLVPTDAPDLELKVTMYNINIGHNQELLEHCRTLNEYAIYVSKVREYTAQMPTEEAVERAVDECIRAGILADFLIKNRAEVVRMSIFEYDKQREDEKLQREVQEKLDAMQENMDAMQAAADQRVAEEKQRVAEEKHRADRAEAELAKLKALYESADQRR